MWRYDLRAHSAHHGAERSPLCYDRSALRPLLDGAVVGPGFHICYVLLPFSNACLSVLEFGFCFSVPGDRHRTYWFSELVGYRLLDSEDMRIPWREHDIAGSVRPVVSSDAVVYF